MADWELLPNSPLTGPIAASLPRGGGTAVAISLTSAWNSAVLDTQRARVILPRNGGHADGAHNGCRAFDLTTNQWSFLSPDSLAYTPMDPTLPASAYSFVYADGTPSSVHTYDGVCYMPNVNRVLSARGIYWSPNGESVGPNGTVEFDLNTNSWIMNTPDRPGGYTCAMVWDPVTLRVLFHTSAGFYAYDPVARTYTTLFSGSSSGFGEGSSAFALDNAKRLIWWTNEHSVAPFHINKIDLNNLALKSQPVTVTGDVSISATKGPGLVFKDGILVGYGRNVTGTGSTLYLLDPYATTPTWTRLTTGGTIPPLPCGWGSPASGGPGLGTWKKFFEYQGRLHVVTHLGIYRILPDGGTIPSTIIVKVAASYQVDYVSTPPDPPDPPGGGTPLPLNTWALVPAPPAGAPPNSRIGVGKHLRALRDTLRNRFVLAGGDSWGSDFGNPQVTVWDQVTGLTTVLSPKCVPAPGIMPNFPDNVVWVHDTKRDQYLMFKGFFFGGFEPPVKPTTTLTPSATTGSITLTQGAGSNWPFQTWMVGKRVIQWDVVNGTTIVAHATIDSVSSATVATATVGLAFANTTAIVQNAWAIEKVLAGKAATVCGRNAAAGDTGVINDDLIFNPTTNTWQVKTWPLSAAGPGTDAAGPVNGAYDEATDSVYMLKASTGLMILHRNTVPESWELIAVGTGMAAGTEKTLVTSSSNVIARAMPVLAGRFLYYFSNSLGKEAFIEFNMDTKVWHAYPVPAGYVPNNSEAGPDLALWYDPVSHVVIHANSFDITSDIYDLYILTLATKTIERRPIAVIPNVQGNQPIRNGSPFWNPELGAIGLFGRTVTGMQGYTCWHYRYGP